MAFTKVVGAGIHTLSNITSHNIHSSGILTATGLDISGDATIGGVLTYEDVTSIDSVGIITARNGIDCNADIDVDGHTNLDNVSIAGVTTFGGAINGSSATFTGAIDANGDLDVDGHTNLDNVNVGGATTTTGVVVINAGTQSTNTTSGALRVAGGAGIAKNVNVGGDLDVDGHTNLDNVSVAGVTTFSDDVKFDGATAGRDITFDRSDNRLKFSPDSRLSFGDNSAKHLEIRQTGDFAYIQKAGSSGWIDVSGDVKLNNDLDIVGDLDIDGHTELDNVNITGFTTFATGTRFFHHTPRIEMQGNTTATLSFVNATTGTTTNDGMLMGFSSSSKAGFINVLEGAHGFVLKTGGSALGNERINISGVGTISLRYGTTEEMVTARPNGAVELFYDGNKRLETSSVGVSIPQDLDVDGHTNLDNVSIAGVTTTTGQLTLSGTHGEKIILQGANAPLIRWKEGTTEKAFIQWQNSGFLRIYNQEDNSVLRIKDTLDFSPDNSSFYTIWHSGNDGPGSGLNADTLDGIQGASFLRSDQADTTTGQLTLSGTHDEKLILSGSAVPYIRFQENTTDKAYIQWSTDGFLQFVNQETGEILRIKSDELTFTVNGTENKVFHAGNDGPGSGLNADTLDGVQGSSFLRSDANDTASGDLTFNGVVSATNDGNTPDKIGDFKIGRNINSISSIDNLDSFLLSKKDGSYPSGTKPSGTNNAFGVLSLQTHSGDYFSQLGFYSSGNELYIRSTNNTTTYSGWQKVWSENNDGSGSGLDADTLDGVQGASFLRSDANDNVGGVLTFTSGSGLNLSTNDIYLNARVINNQAGGSDDGLYIGYNNANSGATRIYGGGTTSGGLVVAGNGANNLTFNSNKVFHAGNDGSGSGLDADKLDGVQGSSFLRSDLNDTATGQITLSGGVSTNGKDVYISNGAVISSDADGAFAARSGSNIDHLWHDDSSADGMGGTWHFCSDTTYKANGNARVYAGFFSRAGNKVWDEGNDGAGSGLDSDKLDGEEGSYYRNASNINAGTIPDARIPDIITPVTLVQTIELRTGNGQQLVLNAGESAGKVSGQGAEYVYVNAEQGLSVNTPSSANANWSGGTASDQTVIKGTSITIDGNTVFHQGNDGSGSGLDADTLDGIQGSNFLRSDTSDTMSLGAGALTLDKGGNANQALDVSCTATSGATRIRFLESGSSKGELAYSHDNDQLELVARSGQKIAMYTNAHNSPYMTLSTSGYMNVPSQPGIYLDGLDWSSSNRYMHAGYQFWQNGNNWNNSTGTFTCPIAGKYLVAADAQGHNTHFQSGASDTYANLIPHRNNSGYGLESVATTKGDNGGTHIHTVFGFSIIMDCAVNDTIRVYSNHGFRSNTQNHLAIWLLG